MDKRDPLECALDKATLKGIKKDLDTVIQAQITQDRKLDDLLNFEGPLSQIKLQVSTNTNDISGLKTDVTVLQADTKSNSTRLAEMVGKYSFYAGVIYLFIQEYLKGGVS